jgi:hypothetical protein
MYRKLRPPALNTEGILGIIAISSFLVMLVLSYRIAMGFGSFICFVAFIISLIVTLRTGNKYFIPQLSGQFFASILLMMIATMEVKPYAAFFIPVAGLMGISFTLMLIFIFQRRLKWRTRETLELAAQPVSEKTNGLTNRPLQAGKVDYTIEELHGFASFIKKNLIAIPVTESERVVFILNIPFTRLLSFNNKYTDRTYVSFDYSGNVTVTISQDDYFMYRDQWAFDQLCSSLGNLFIDFMEQYRNGSSALIIHRMNALNLNIITEG